MAPLGHLYTDEQIEGSTAQQRLGIRKIGCHTATPYHVRSARSTAACHQGHRTARIQVCPPDVGQITVRFVTAT
jgi:hypothetical protein